MKFNHYEWLRLFRSGALLCLAACTAMGAEISYSFTATTRATVGSPAHLEQLELRVPDVLPLDAGTLISFTSSDPAVMSCLACAPSPLLALHFLRSSTTDLFQFRDADGILRAYFFPTNSLTQLGVHDSMSGINMNVGRMVVSEVSSNAPVPEPSSAGLIAAGGAMMSLGVWRRRRRAARAQQLRT